MGYMGLGMQRWISTMKPRKFLGKRSKPDGGGVEKHNKKDIEDYYHLEPTKLNRLLSKRYSENYRKKLKLKLEKSNKSSLIKMAIGFIIVLAIFISLLIYFNHKFGWF